MFSLSSKIPYSFMIWLWSKNAWIFTYLINWLIIFCYLTIFFDDLYWKEHTCFTVLCHSNTSKLTFSQLSAQNEVIYENLWVWAPVWWYSWHIWPYLFCTIIISFIWAVRLNSDWFLHASNSVSLAVVKLRR